MLEIQHCPKGYLSRNYIQLVKETILMYLSGIGEYLFDSTEEHSSINCHQRYIRFIEDNVSVYQKFLRKVYRPIMQWENTLHLTDKGLSDIQWTYSSEQMILLNGF